MGKIKIYGASYGKGFVYIVLPLKEMRSKALWMFLQKYFPEYTKEKYEEELEKRCTWCYSKIKTGKTKYKHRHDESFYHRKGKEAAFFIKGRSEIHVIFLGKRAGKISLEAGNLFKFVK